LAEQETSFQALYESTRRKIADELLSEANLPVSDIAYRLGFSAVGNFTRAARRWFDHSPSDWRRMKRQEIDSESME
jgi:AraC-like DNA-binding protein